MSIKIISRGKGKSAVAAAAYRAGEKITNSYDGITHDYTRKGGVAHTEILLPENAPAEYADRATLWNAVEQGEKNCNAQLSREIELALPVELSPEQKRQLVRDYCQQHFVAAGMCADICIHDKSDGNPHAHVMLTMRPFELDGSWAAKSKKEYILDENGQRIILASGAFKTRKVDATDWNDHGKAEVWRAGWAGAVNTALEREGVAGRIDHRSYERQGVEQIPTVHMGVAAFQMEKRSIRTERGDINRQVQLDNNMIRQLRARINKLQSGLDELMAEAAAQPIPLADVLIGILEKPEEAPRRRRITNLQVVAKAISFLQANRIADLPGLRDKVADMCGQLGGVNDRLRQIDRREKTLAEHIRHVDNYFAHRALYKQYQQVKPKRQADFYEANRTGLALYEAAARYLKEVMNGRTALPLKEWKAEAAALPAEKRKLYMEYDRLKSDVQEAETIRRAVEQVLREPDKNIRRARGMER